MSGVKDLHMGEATQQIAAVYRMREGGLQLHDLQ